MLSKILGLMAIGETVTGLGMTRQFVENFAVIIFLSVVGAMMAGALTLFGLYGLYDMLTRHGLDADVALGFAGGAGLFLLVAILIILVYKIRHVRSLPFKLSTLGSTGLSSLHAVWRGFQRGLTDDPPV